MVLSSAPAGATASATNRHATAALMACSSLGLDVDVLDDVAQVSRRIPKGLRPLRFADPVERADHQPMLAGVGRSPGRRPLPKRVSPQVRAKLDTTPRRPPVAGE